MKLKGFSCHRHSSETGLSIGSRASRHRLELRAAAPLAARACAERGGRQVYIRLYSCVQRIVYRSAVH